MRMHLRSLRIVKSFIPVKDLTHRKRALRKLKAAMRSNIAIHENKDGISLEGEFLPTEVEKLDEVTDEVYSWGKSSRRSK